MEYVQGKSLHSYLRKRPKMRLSEDEAKIIFK
jgi:serine/threonine protein kinase